MWLVRWSSNCVVEANTVDTIIAHIVWLLKTLVYSHYERVSESLSDYKLQTRSKFSEVKLNLNFEQSIFRVCCQTTRLAFFCQWPAAFHVTWRIVNRGPIRQGLGGRIHMHMRPHTVTTTTWQFTYETPFNWQGLLWVPYWATVQQMKINSYYWLPCISWTVLLYVWRKIDLLPFVFVEFLLWCSTYCVDGYQTRGYINILNAGTEKHWYVKVCVD